MFLNYLKIALRNISSPTPAFLRIFDFQLVEGDPTTALTRPRSVVLTESTAKQFFGDASPVGQTVRVDAEDFPEFGGATISPEQSRSSPASTGSLIR